MVSKPQFALAENNATIRSLSLSLILMYTSPHPPFLCPFLRLHPSLSASTKRRPFIVDSNGRNANSSSSEHGESRRKAER